jgi:hypothetical protein
LFHQLRIAFGASALIASLLTTDCLAKRNVAVPVVSGIARVELDNRLPEEDPELVTIRDKDRIDALTRFLNQRRALWYEARDEGQIALPIELHFFDVHNVEVLIVHFGPGGMIRWLDAQHPAAGPLLYLDTTQDAALNNARELCRIVGGRFERETCPLLLSG